MLSGKMSGSLSVTSAGAVNVEVLSRVLKARAVIVVRRILDSSLRCLPDPEDQILAHGCAAGWRGGDAQQVWTVSQCGQRQCDLEPGAPRHGVERGGRQRRRQIELFALETVEYLRLHRE